ncbi:MAG: hypothetical protein M3N53_12720 [Actinomycetota bacterium]|nr:hypothetical protein [Actinomycetota bacterium]
MNGIATLAGSIGRGLFAGAFGTVVMTLSSTIEMKLRGREGSSAPADAAGKLLGVEPTDDDAKERFSTMVHFGYGTGWGAARGVIGYAGLAGPAAAAAHLAAVWGTELVMLPALNVAPPATKWGSKEVSIDWFHHAVYAIATSVAYEWLDR